MSNSLGSFINYKQVVMTLANDLNKLKSYSNKLKLSKSIELIDTILEKIKTESFSLAIVGKFNRGKSKLINALLGQEILLSQDYQ